MDLAKYFYVVSLSTFLALLVVWESTLIRERGYRLDRLNTEVQRSEARAQIYRAQLGKLKSPGRVVHLLKELQIDLVPATERAPAGGGAGGDAGVVASASQ